MNLTPTNPTNLTNLTGLTRSDLLALIADIGQKPFRAQQLWQWIWRRGVRDFDEMTDLAKDFRAELKERCVVDWPEIDTLRRSKDGTLKFLLALEDGESVECVLIPGDGRYTLCLSTQVGCAMGCTFCSTGTMGFTRNLTMAEILGQILVARGHIEENGLPPLTNLVFMGMGEPMLNLQELLRALEVLGDQSGLNYSARRVTVSTCGIAKGLQELGHSARCSLAVSLHAADQELRARIMPKAAQLPLDDLMRALDDFPLKPRQWITYEYILLKGVNDSIAHAKALVRLLGQRKAKINLIAYNPPPPDTYGPTPEIAYEAPDMDRVLAFEKYLWSRGMTAILRKSMGSDIAAACGQLKASLTKPT